MFMVHSRLLAAFPDGALPKQRTNAAQESLFAVDRRSVSPPFGRACSRVRPTGAARVRAIVFRLSNKLGRLRWWKGALIATATALADPDTRCFCPAQRTSRFGCLT